MAKKKKVKANVPDTTKGEMLKSSNVDPNKTFLFGQHNYLWMIIGLVVIALGFGLMMGADANTIDGKFDPNVWNQEIFSWRRIRLAPILVLGGFIIEIYAIMSSPKNS